MGEADDRHAKAGGVDSVPDVAEALAARIASGEFATGSRMPGEHQLAAEYGIPRGRVRTALAALARRGLVRSKPRSGWIVQNRRQTQGFDRMRSFAAWAHDAERVAGGTVLECVRSSASAREATSLGIRLGDEVRRMTRTRSLDGRVVMLERSVWAPWVAAAVDLMPQDIASTTAFLADSGVQVVAGTHQIEAVAASSEDARMLGVRRGSPLLQVQRRTTTAEGRPVEIGVDRYVPGAIAFTFEAGAHGGLARASI